MDSSDKKSLSERDICTKFITPTIIHSGWDQNHQIREDLIMHILNAGGRAAIVLPDGTLFSDGVKNRIMEFAPEDYGDPVELLREYERIRAEAAATREALKRELMASLGEKNNLLRNGHA